MKTNNKNDIIFPVFDYDTDKFDREIIQIFLSRYRDILFQRDEMRVWSAIHKTADLTGNSEGVIAKTLVDYGLRVARASFPQDFLDHIDQLNIRSHSNRIEELPESYADLIEFWAYGGEDPFAFIYGASQHYEIPSFMTV